MATTKISASIFSAALSSVLAAQVTVAVPCAKDNTLYESPTGGLSNGAGNDLFVGVTGQTSNALRRAVLYFDVAGAVPAGAIIVDASLTIRISRTSFTPPTGVSGHRLLQDWGEGTSTAFGGGGSGAPAAANDATWIHTFHPTGFWTNPGGDFAATPSFAIATSSTGSTSTTASAALVADVQTFLDQPAQNFGWLLKTDEATASRSLRLDSRETISGTAPVLQVTYLTNGQSIAIGQGCPINGQPFTHAWGAAPIGGTTVQLAASQGPANALAATLLSLSFDPVGALIGPPCPAHLPLTSPIATLDLGFLDASGSRSVSFAVPGGFPGIVIASQVAAVDNGPARFTLSNAVVALLQ